MEPRVVQSLHFDSPKDYINGGGGMGREARERDDDKFVAKIVRDKNTALEGISALEQETRGASTGFSKLAKQPATTNPFP